MVDTLPTQDVSASDLLSPCWSVVSFEKREAFGLVYADAAFRMKELDRRRIAGLCIITDEAAERLASIKTLK